MVKYVCDECSETIEVYYVELNFEGKKLQFCTDDCMNDYVDKYVKENMSYVDIDEDNYEE